jgi:hypothetical protein
MMNRRKFRAFGSSKKATIDEDVEGDINDVDDEDKVGVLQGDIGGEEDQGDEKVSNYFGFFSVI